MVSRRSFIGLLASPRLRWLAALLPVTVVGPRLLTAAEALLLLGVLLVLNSAAARRTTIRSVEDGSDGRRLLSTFRLLKIYHGKITTFLYLSLIHI